MNLKSIGIKWVFLSSHFAMNMSYYSIQDHNKFGWLIKNVFHAIKLCLFVLISKKLVKKSLTFMGKLEEILLILTPALVLTKLSVSKRLKILIILSHMELWGYEGIPLAMNSSRDL